MERYGISVDVKNVPVLDPEFTPILKFNRAFLKDAAKPVSIAVERADGQIATTHILHIVTPLDPAVFKYPLGNAAGSKCHDRLEFLQNQTHFPYYRL